MKTQTHDAMSLSLHPVFTMSLSLHHVFTMSLSLHHVFTSVVWQFGPVVTSPSLISPNNLP
ncbi:hypothetical protein F7725_021047 [Dissostichus mawsoni]|uniref:Uncharacterized protein n=1 Tax=Dissostichus mawsoni TaxID=36200 RepID=A0A7J5YGV7_DISMA|nr:hypothetical protein F7725_021047 [Dissostichus mawsoni]